LFDMEPEEETEEPSRTEEEEQFEPSSRKSSEEESEEEEGSPDLKKLLMEKLSSVKSKPKPKPAFHYNISKTISVDSAVLNFGSFYPEKLLGSILTVTN